MLNKEVCRRCEYRLREGSISDGNESFVKDFLFEPIWERGIVWCKRSSQRFNRYHAGIVRVEASPPERCPYVVEHVVSQDA